MGNIKVVGLRDGAYTHAYMQPASVIFVHTNIKIETRV